MKLSFVEALDFTKVVYEYFGGDTEFAAFQEALLANPDRGDVMPGCGGLRKTRWRDVRRSKGSRGGLRIIYLYVPVADRVFLVDVYDKDEADDLTPDENVYWRPSRKPIVKKCVAIRSGIDPEFVQTLR